MRGGVTTIYGISQSSGAERRLRFEPAGAGVLLTISDHVGNVERERIIVPADSLLSTIMDPPAGGSTIEGTSPAHGKKKLLDLEVRRNEVLLKAHGESGDGYDVAVGLDDFQDALEAVVTSG